MADILTPLSAPSTYRDSRANIDARTQAELLERSSTLYCGNLSFYTTEEQIYALFSQCAGGQGIKRIIMGLDRNTKTPCGFAFVEYYSHQEAVDAIAHISGTKLDERIIRCDIDAQGYKEGRQFGRGKSGGQVRDEYRQEYDSGRGGWGHLKARQEAERQERERREQQRRVYEDAQAGDAPAGASGRFETLPGEEDRGAQEGAGGLGTKREREEDAEGEGGQRENPRFREEDDED